jgi:hypothetical protein
MERVRRVGMVNPGVRAMEVVGWVGVGLSAERSRRVVAVQVVEPGLNLL